MEVIDNKYYSYDAKQLSSKKNSDIFVKVSFYKGRVFDHEEYISIDRIDLGEDIKKVKPLKSYKDLQKLGKNIPFIRNDKSTSIKDKYLNATISMTDGKIDLYGETIKVDPIYHTTEIPAKVDGKEIPHGLKRALKVESAKEGSTDKYVMVYKHNENSPTFVKLKDLYYMDGLNAVQLTRYSQLSTLDYIYTADGEVLDKVYAAEQFELKEVVASEKFDAKTDTLTTYTIMDGKVEYKDTKIDTEICEHKFVEVPDVVQNDPKKVNTTYMVANQFFTKNDHGEYISVRLKGDVVETRVSIKDIYPVSEDTVLSEHNIPVETLKNYIGESILVKINDRVVETEPLTIVQAEYRYEKEKFLQETFSQEDILGENTYVRVEDGRFIKEVEIAKPICYNFVDEDASDEGFDAFVAVVHTAEGDKFEIIDKNAFVNGNLNAKVGDKIYNKQSLLKVKRVEDIENCDIVQVTSKPEKNTANDCVLLKTPKYASGKVVSREDVERKDELIKNSKEYVKNQYKQGKYNIDIAIVDGKKVVLDNKKIRFKETDTFLQTDYENNKTIYQGLKSGKMYIDITKNKIEGGPKFSFKKGFKSKITKVNKKINDLIKRFGNPIILMFVAPYIVLRLVYGYLSAFFSSLNKKIDTRAALNAYARDKYAGHKKVVSKNLKKEMVNLYEKVKDKKVVNKIGLLKEIKELKLHAKTLGRSKSNNSLHFVDGKAKINNTNAYLAAKYEKDFSDKSLLSRALKSKIDKKKSLISKLEEKIAKNPNKAKKCERWNAKIDKVSKEVKKLGHAYTATDGSLQSMKSGKYVARGGEYKPSGDRAGIDTRIDRMKNFLLAKYCDEIDPQYKPILKDLEYDVEKNQYFYKGKKVDPKLLEGKQVKHLNKKIAAVKDKIVGAIVACENNQNKTLETESIFVKVENSVLKPKEEVINPEPIQKTDEHVEERVVKEEKKSEKTTKAPSKDKILAENNLFKSLKNEKSTIHKKVEEMLIKKGYSKEDAEKEIIRVADEILKNNRNNISAGKVFEKGSIEAFIYSKARTIHTNLITVKKNKEAGKTV